MLIKFVKVDVRIADQMLSTLPRGASLVISLQIERQDTLALHPQYFGRLVKEEVLKHV